MNTLSMEHISKQFGLVEVLHDVQFEVVAGEVHALMGENGAGKSTLMNILAGVIPMTSGVIKINGQVVSLREPKDAQSHGIVMIHQELSTLPEMTVAENIFLGREPRRGIFLDYRKINHDAVKLLTEMNLRVNPHALASSLPVANLQLIEIAKAISLNADLFIMDEPTSSLSENEVDVLFALIRQLKRQKKSVIYISHKMNEVFQIADRITVLRDGHYINTWKANMINENALINKMVGRDLNEMYPKKPISLGITRFEIKRFSRKNEFTNISFQIKCGEILGIGGLIGAGRSELCHAIFGLTRPDEGDIFIDGKKISIHCPQDAIRAGIAYVTEDRKNEALVFPMSIKNNTSLSSLKNYCQNGFIDFPKEKAAVWKKVSELAIKISSLSQLVGNLSGGNQQKVVLARWLMISPKLLILDEPTRGIDVGAKAEIYKLMDRFVSAGNAILMVSSELPELIGMSDRILIFSKGKLTGEMEKTNFSQESIMRKALVNI